AREAECLGEMVHDLGVIVEGVCEFLRVRPVAMPETGIIRRDQAIPVREPCEERLEHPRRRRKSMQQEKRWGILRSSLSIENRQAVDLQGAIESGVVHRTFLSLRQKNRAARAKPGADCDEKSRSVQRRMGHPPVANLLFLLVECRKKKFQKRFIRERVLT